MDRKCLAASFQACTTLPVDYKFAHYIQVSSTETMLLSEGSHTSTRCNLSFGPGLNYPWWVHNFTVEFCSYKTFRHGEGIVGTDTHRKLVIYTNHESSLTTDDSLTDY